MSVERLDVGDETAVRRWFATFVCAADDLRALPIRTTFEDFYVSLHDPSWPGAVFWLRSGAAAMGTLVCRTSVYENRHLVDLDIRVPPEHRRQGNGTALLEAAEAHATDDGRSVLMSEVVEPLTAVAGSTPGARFAAAAGFRVGMVETHQVIELPVAPERLSALAVRAAERAHGYQLVEFGMRCPPEHVEGFCEAQSRFLHEAPLGDLDVEPETWTPDRLREAEKRRAQQGREGITVLAIAPGGAVAGYTQLVVPPSNDGRVAQADTLVLPEHRGHRLGLAMKVRNLQRLQQRFPDRTYVGTWNADSNAAMRAVNAELGAAPRERMLEYQRAVSA